MFSKIFKFLSIAKDINVISGFVPKNKHTNFASDHYPIVFDIEF